MFRVAGQESHTEFLMFHPVRVVPALRWFPVPPVHPSSLTWSRKHSTSTIIYETAGITSFGGAFKSASRVSCIHFSCIKILTRSEIDCQRCVCLSPPAQISRESFVHGFEIIILASEAIYSHTSHHHSQVRQQPMDGVA